MPFQVAVCGPADCSDADRDTAFRLGELLAARGAVVLCGGGAGVMAAVAAGARSRGGLAIGISPAGTRPADTRRAGSEPTGTDPAGTDPTGGEPAGDLSAVVLTGMGQARNAILVRSADAVISVGGSWGTLSEIALAMRRGDIPVISLSGWRVSTADGSPVPGVHHAGSAEEAVTRALGEA